MDNDIYKAPKATLVEKPKAKKSLSILCWVMSLISFLMLLPIGISHGSGSYYAFGFSLSIIIMAYVLSIPFYLFRYFRSPNPRRVLYLILLTLFILITIPELLMLTSGQQLK